MTTKAVTTISMTAKEPNARDRILNRLRSRTAPVPTPPPSDFSVLTQRQWSAAEKIELFQSTIESVHGEVLHTRKTDWVAPLVDWLTRKGITRLLAPQTTELGQALRAQWPSDAPELMAYDQPIESWQPELFHQVDAAITSTRGGIAETGSLIVWPSPEEPRLMSLVPPLHIAVLDTDTLYSNFLEAMTAQRWADGMPTNALLISGPSKTADIEQTLAYGIHGPAELLVVLRQ